jgi:glycosyltransferase involved in cell wall biosynthesis
VVSIIIPAHNEEQVIARGLAALIGAADGEQEIIVVCNGCTDSTAAMARAYGNGVKVIETATASKTHALNLGEGAACGFPRFFVDADVQITRASIALIEQFMARTGALAAAPAAQMDLSGCSRLVRWYYDVDLRLPSSRYGIGCAGVYVLSAEGRRRFGEFPPIVADDAFVRLQFRPEERVRVEGAVSVVRAPRTVKELLAVMTRVHFGNTELHKLAPHLWANHDQGNGKTLFHLMKRPSLWPKIASYLSVKTIARLRSRWRYARARHTVWERDETARQAAMPETG